MKKIYIIVFMLIQMFALASCGSNTTQTGSKVKLLSFNLLDNADNDTSKKNLKFAQSNDKNSAINNLVDDKYCVVEDNNLSFEILVENDERYSFIDMVLYLEQEKTSVVFNEGNGTYTCSVTTMLKDDVWVSQIIINLNVEFEDDFTSKIEVENISFYDFNNQKCNAIINDDVKK